VRANCCFLKYFLFKNISKYIFLSAHENNLEHKELILNKKIKIFIKGYLKCNSKLCFGACLVLWCMIFFKNIFYLKIH